MIKTCIVCRTNFEAHSRRRTCSMTCFLENKRNGEHRRRAVYRLDPEWMERQRQTSTRARDRKCGVKKKWNPNRLALHAYLERTRDKRRDQKRELGRRKKAAKTRALAIAALQKVQMEGIEAGVIKNKRRPAITVEEQREKSRLRAYRTYHANREEAARKKRNWKREHPDLVRAARQRYSQRLALRRKNHEDSSSTQATAS